MGDFPEEVPIGYLNGEDMVERYRDEEMQKQVQQQNKDFLFLSKEEFDTYKRTGNLNRFRQAANKLFALAENIAEAETNQFFKDFQQFATAFKQSEKIKFVSDSEKLDFLIKLKALHSLYYHGIEEATDLEALENTYKEVYDKLKKGMR